MVSYPQAKSRPEKSPFHQKPALHSGRLQGDLGRLRATSKTRTRPDTTIENTSQNPHQGDLGRLFIHLQTHFKKQGQLGAISPSCAQYAWLREKSRPKSPCTPTYPQAGASHE